MSDPKIKIYKYELPLLCNFPRALSANLIAEGYVIQLESETGYKAFGEISRASLQPNECFLTAKDQLMQASLSWEVASDKYYPPVIFAITSARKQIENYEKSQTFVEGIGQTALCVISLNALLDASITDFVDEGLKWHAQGYKVLKIKVGESEIGEEIGRIRELISILGNDVVIRLDANQKMTIFEAVEFVKSLKKVRIEYFEEPFKEVEALEEFYRLTKVKVALDETLLKKGLEEWIEHEAVGVYVVKPSRIGSESRVQGLLMNAIKKGKKFVISSTFESGIGISMISQYAFVQQRTDVAMGLATGSYYASDLLTPPIRAFRGKLLRETAMGNLQKVDLDRSPFCTLL